LLLHVVDAANPDFPEQMAQVQAVLADIGAADVPQLLVFNKMDALPAERLPQRLQDDYEVDGRPVPRIFVSAAHGDGLSTLREALSQRALAGVAAYEFEEDPQNVMEPGNGTDSGPTFRHNG
jgi:GTP-binding protein HflX